MGKKLTKYTKSDPHKINKHTPTVQIVIDNTIKHKHTL